MAAGTSTAARRHLGGVVWPAFLGAGALEALVFAFVDPQALHVPGGGALGGTPLAIYSIAFFAFWAVVAGACLLTQVLGRSAAEVNEPAGDTRPGLNTSDR